MSAALTRVFPSPDEDRTTTVLVDSPSWWKRRGLLAGAALLILAIVSFSLAPVREYLWAWFNPATVDNIAVLPLTNLSGDPANDFFADGVTEVLMSRLGMIDSLRVIARSSVNAVPSGERDPASLYKRLGAKYIVEGSVQRQENRVRITARLVDGSTGTLRWTDTYERPLGDIFALQGEMATAMATEVGASLTGETTRRLMARQTTSNEAQDAYLQGRYLLNTFSRARLPEASALLERAVALDGSYAIAYASLSRAYAMMLDIDMGPARVLQPLAVARGSTRYRPESGPGGNQPRVCRYQIPLRARLGSGRRRLSAGTVARADTRASFYPLIRDFSAPLDDSTRPCNMPSPANKPIRCRLKWLPVSALHTITDVSSTMHCGTSNVLQHSLRTTGRRTSAWAVFIRRAAITHRRSNTSERR